MTSYDENEKNMISKEEVFNNLIVERIIIDFLSGTKRADA